jgi:hypothetical protein
LLGAAALAIGELIFVEGGAAKGEVLLDNGGRALLSFTAEFHATDFLLQLGHREQFISAPVLQFRSQSGSEVFLARKSSPFFSLIFVFFLSIFGIFRQFS